MLITALFTAYIAYYWKSGVKSISLSSYQNGNYSRAGFALFMIALGILFAHYDGKQVLGFDMFSIAGGFLCIAGLSFNHQTTTIKQIHHVTSTIAILFGFIALWNIWAVFLLIVLSGIAYFVERGRFLWWLEIFAFYIIQIFTL